MNQSSSPPGPAVRPSNETCTDTTIALPDMTYSQ
jgi:hypothetical protein